MKIIDINGNERECVKVTPDLEWPGYMKAEIIDRNGTHSEWYLLDDFIKLNSNLKYLANGAPPEDKDDLGVVTGSKTNTLTDKKKAWEDNIYVGTPIWISRGKGEGQVRTIISNSKNSVEINQEWDILPDNSSQYVISFNIHNPKAAGNSLPSPAAPLLNLEKKQPIKTRKKS